MTELSEWGVAFKKACGGLMLMCIPAALFFGLLLAPEVTAPLMIVVGLIAATISIKKGGSTQ